MREIVLNADQLRKLTGNRPSALRLRLEELQGTVKHKVKRNEIYIVLDNVLDTYNIGSVFRLADAVAAKKVYLCGGSETPPNHRIKKASINTTEVVEWEYSESAVKVINDLRLKIARRSKGAKDIQIISIEQAATSIPYDKFEYKMPVVLVVGHESDGVSPEVLQISDAIVELPMFGINKSLNVMVSLGIVLYHAISKASSAYQVIEDTNLESRLKS